MRTFKRRFWHPRAPAADEARATAGYGDVVRLCAERLGLVPDEVQRRILESGAKRGILNCCRQWGKTQVIAVKAVHRALTRPGSLTVVAAPSLPQSGEFVLAAKDLLRKVEVRTRGDGVRDTSLVLSNGSRMVGLPASDYSTRGLRNVGLLVFDEAAQVPDAVYKTLRPMLAVSGGDLWMMSTPNGKRGFFYETWSHGGEMWERYSVKATECPRIPPEFLEEERRVHGGLWFRQEYLCEFVEMDGTLFERRMVEDALADEVRPLGSGGGAGGSG